VRRILGMPFLDNKRLHEEAEEILERLHIKVPSTHVRVKNLSGGQRQAIAIGRSVSFDPKVLILDEPTASLAVKEVGEVLDLISRLKSRGVGVILISHRLQDIIEVTDRIMFMYEGRKVAERRTSETDLEEVIKLIVQG
jgi:simple sugar transport system ATP-binding protein